MYTNIGFVLQTIIRRVSHIVLTQYMGGEANRDARWLTAAKGHHAV